MTRRDRTTGLPTASRGRRSATSVGEGSWLSSQRTRQIAILGVALAAVLVVAGLLVYNWYDSSIAQPREVVLRVDAEEFSLSYFSARLPGFAQSNPAAGGLLLTQELLNQLETEGLTLIAAAERGIVLSDEDVTQAIALSLGVLPDSTRGGLFDTRYREALTTSGLNDGQYRQRAEALEADRQLRAALLTEIGTTGEIVYLRVVTTASLEEASAVHERIVAGEDMGTVAQEVSLDIESRQNNGELVSPPLLLDEALQAALADAEEGTLLDPIEAGETFWVVRLEQREADGDYQAGQAEALMALRLADVLEETRSRVIIERDLSTDDASWAIDQTN